MCLAFIELFLISDFYYLEAFLDEVGRELPEFFKVAVAVEDGRKIFGRVVVFERLHGDERDKDRKQRPCRSFYGCDISYDDVCRVLLAPFCTDGRGMTLKANRFKKQLRKQARGGIFRRAPALVFCFYSVGRVHLRPVLPAGMPYFLRSSRRASTALLMCSLFSAWS